MRFKDILGNEKLWAVVYDGETEDVLTKTFSQWLDLNSLYDFFERNVADLAAYFHITDISQAVFETVSDALYESDAFRDQSGRSFRQIVPPVGEFQGQ